MQHGENMARKERTDRLNLTLTLEQTEKLNTYIVNVGRKLGRIPAGMKTKILRAALDEWFQNHGNDLNIDWNSKD